MVLMTGEEMSQPDQKEYISIGRSFPISGPQYIHDMKEREQGSYQVKVTNGDLL